MSHSVRPRYVGLWRLLVAPSRGHQFPQLVSSNLREKTLRSFVISSGPASCEWGDLKQRGGACFESDFPEIVLAFNLG